MAALYCSTTDVAFGPIFSDGGAPDYHDADERAESFLRFLKNDARTYSDAELQAEYSAWLTQESAQWKAEDESETARLAGD